MKTLGLELRRPSERWGRAAGEDESARTPMEVVFESKIAGEFEGYDKGKVFVLTNGQRWQQVGSQDQYRYMHQPKVKILQAGRRHYLEVDDADLNPVRVVPLV